MTPSLFKQTPSITAFDARGLAVRTIEYLRHPETPALTRALITRHRHDARGFAQQRVDPRLYEAGVVNLDQVSDLAGKALRTRSVDAGIHIVLYDSARRPVTQVSRIGIDDQGNDDPRAALTRCWHYEDAGKPGRVLSVTEQAAGEPLRISERFVWAGASSGEVSANQAGRCVSHYGSEGLQRSELFSVAGRLLRESRRLLEGAGAPELLADWQGADPDAWNEKLDGPVWTTLRSVDALGAVLTCTDAQGHRRRVAYDRAGLPKSSWLALAGGPERVIVKACDYSATGRKLREEHGNQVLTRYSYDACSERLARMRTERPAGHPLGARLLLDLQYTYDPRGNVLRVRDDAQETRYWRNQQVAPQNGFGYDSLYRLVLATGREMADDGVSQGNYQRSYGYDLAGNLVQIRHSASATRRTFSTTLVVSERSNRAVTDSLAALPAEVESLFSADGLQHVLLPGQALAWTAGGHLAAVTSSSGALDEQYLYDSHGQRVLKISRQGNASQRTHYLAQLQLRTTHHGRGETGHLEVITSGDAGQAQVRLLHWAAGKPADIANDQLRYSYDDRLGSSLLELDQDGRLVSREDYYPYGGTALWSATGEAEVDCKTLRYSGQERDATGLYYHGQRYSQPWVGRWLSADPAGTVDGLNLFRAMRNNPATLRDSDGRAPRTPEQEQEARALALRDPIYALPSRDLPYASPFNTGFSFVSVDLDEDYRIYLDTRSRANKLIITAHGGFLPWGRDLRIPEGMTLGFFNPDGTVLADPGINIAITGRSKVFVSMDAQSVTPLKQEAQALLDEGRGHALSGSRKPAHVRDYDLAKYPEDSIDVLLNALSVNRFHDPSDKFDVLTVRNRKGLSALFRSPSLKGVLRALEKRGIAYGGVYGLFCRSNVLRRNPTFDSLQARDV